MTDEMILTLEEYEDYKARYFSWENDRFTAFIWQSRVILFSKKVYCRKDGSIKSICLKSIRTYTFDEAENQLNSDLYTYAVEGECR